MVHRSKLSLSIFFLAFFFLPRIAQGAQLARMRMTMGAWLEIEVTAKDPGLLAPALETAFSEVDRWDKLLSNFKEDSEISQINRNAYPQAVTVSSDVFKFVEKSKFWSIATHNAFAIGIKPLTDLWHLRSPKPERLPRSKELTAALERIDPKLILTSSAGYTIQFLKPGMGLDTGGIGKGYALDQALTQLSAYALESVTFNFGGEILYWSRAPIKREVQVRHPINPDQFWKVITLDPNRISTAVSTSGNYYRSANVSDKPGHLINPQTGKPAGQQMRSVTVFAANATDADALSTALFVLEPKTAQTFADAQKESAALLIYSDQKGRLQEYCGGAWKNFVISNGELK